MRWFQSVHPHAARCPADGRVSGGMGQNEADEGRYTQGAGSGFGGSLDCRRGLWHLGKRMLAGGGGVVRRHGGLEEHGGGDLFAAEVGDEFAHEFGELATAGGVHGAQGLDDLVLGAGRRFADQGAGFGGEGEFPAAAVFLGEDALDKSLLDELGDDDGDGALVRQRALGKLVDGEGATAGVGELGENEELGAADAGFLLGVARGDAQDLDDTAEVIHHRAGTFIPLIVFIHSGWGQWLFGLERQHNPTDQRREEEFIPVGLWTCRRSMPGRRAASRGVLGPRRRARARAGRIRGSRTHGSG